MLKETFIRKTFSYSLLAAFESLQTDASSAPNRETFVGNPLNSYLLIKRMTADWKEAKEVMTSSPAPNFLHNVTSIAKAMLKWPSDEDLSGAAQALVRLQVFLNVIIISSKSIEWL